MNLTEPFLRARLLAAAALLGLAPLADADTIVVNQLNFSFTPPDVVVDVGDTVRWVWSGGDHDVTEGTDGTVDGDEAFHSPLTSGTPVFEHTFDAAFLLCHPRPGNVYDYFCSPHFGFGMVGTVTVVDPSQPGGVYCACDDATAAPCGNSGGCGEGCLNSTGLGGKLRASGSTSAGTDDLAFTATDLRRGQPALLFVANNQIAGGNGVPFGDGLRCAGGGLVRLGVDVPDSGGTATWGPGLRATGGWSSGDVRNFQGWYRDPGGNPCGSNFNLTNGYRVEFTP